MSATPLAVDGHEIQLVGNVMVSIVTNTPTEPCVNYHVLSRVLSRCERVSCETGLIAAPWHIVHDFSALVDYEIRAFTAFTHFARWASKNNRQQAVVLFPRGGDEAALKNIQRIVLTLIGQFSGLANGAYHVTQTRDEALALLARQGARLS